MLVVSDRLLMQILMPPAMSGMVLLMGWNAMRSTSPYGILTAGRVRLLWGGFFGMLIFLYGVTFNRELTAAWIENPFALVGIVAFTFSLAQMVAIFTYSCDPSGPDWNCGTQRSEPTG